jgi:hypothetical protein
MKEALRDLLDIEENHPYWKRKRAIQIIRMIVEDGCSTKEVAAHFQLSKGRTRQQYNWGLRVLKYQILKQFPQILRPSVLKDVDPYRPESMVEVQDMRRFGEYICIGNKWKHHPKRLVRKDPLTKEIQII